MAALWLGSSDELSPAWPSAEKSVPKWSFSDECDSMCGLLTGGVKDKITGVKERLGRGLGIK